MTIKQKKKKKKGALIFITVFQEHFFLQTRAFPIWVTRNFLPRWREWKQMQTKAVIVSSKYTKVHLNMLKVKPSLTYIFLPGGKTRRTRWEHRMLFQWAEMKCARHETLEQGRRNANIKIKWTCQDEKCASLYFNYTRRSTLSEVQVWGR